MGASLQPDLKSETKRKNRFIRTGILTILLLSALFYLYRLGSKEIITDQKKLAWEDVAYIDEHGEPQLKEWRMLDLKRQLEELEEAEQYVLIARTDGQYVCYHCNSGTCFLQNGMVWKYGVTRKGMAGRYKAKWLIGMNLRYQVQFVGSHQECLIKEKNMIMLYPLHHDNTVRNVTEQLARPPGNQNDN